MKTVKNKKTLNKLKPLSALLGVAPLLAGSVAFAEDAAEEKPFVSGMLSLMAESHFISYGQDVWGEGDAWSDFFFHPTLELNFDLGNGFTGILGTWWDVNNAAPSQPKPSPAIGHSVQEVDVWVGLGYKYENWSFTLLYQEWMYADQSERIVDFKVGYSHWLNPSVTIHTRVDNELAGFDNGAVGVLGIAPGKSWEWISLSFPVNVAFDTAGFHAGDAGFSFVSFGVGASVPLKFIQRGNWSFESGLTYYITDDDVIAPNKANDSSFLVGSAGIKLTF